MQFALTVADPATQSLADVLVELDDEATVDDLAVALLLAVRRERHGSVSSLAARRSGTTGTVTGPCQLYLGGAALVGASSVRASAVREGSLIGIDEPATPLHEPSGLHDLSIGSGPGAGLVHRLPIGETTVGSAPTCAARFDVAGLAAEAFTVRVDLHGATLLPSPGVDLLLEHQPVTGPVPWPDGACLTVGGSLLVLRPATRPDAALQPSEDGVSLDYNRPPRLLPPLRVTSFELPAPPTAPRRRSLPVLAILAPIVMAGVMVAVLGSFRYAMFAAMSPVMAIGNYVSNRSGSRKQYRDELASYQTHRSQVEQDAREALLAERATRRAQAPDPAEALLIASGPRARLWERRRDDPDYLVLRVATADLPLEVVLRDPEQLSHRRDVTWSALDAPVTVSLAERGVVGLAGRREVTAPLASWMAAQTAVLHSPRDVRLYILTDGAARDVWDWVRWLPHARPEQRGEAAVLIGTDADSISRRLGELQAEIAARWAGRSSAAGATALDEPDIVVVLDGARRLRLLPGVVQVLKQGPQLGIYSLCLDADERLLPEECAAVVVQTGPSTITVRQQRTDVVSDARPDLVPAPWFDRVARALAPVKDVTDEAGDSALPDSCRLLDVVGMEPPTSAAVSAGWDRGGRTNRRVRLDGSRAARLRLRPGQHRPARSIPGHPHGAGHPAALRGRLARDPGQHQPADRPEGHRQGREHRRHRRSRRSPDRQEHPRPRLRPTRSLLARPLPGGPHRRTSARRRRQYREPAGAVAGPAGLAAPRSAGADPPTGHRGRDRRGSNRPRRAGDGNPRGERPAGDPRAAQPLAPGAPGVTHDRRTAASGAIRRRAGAGAVGAGRPAESAGAAGRNHRPGDPRPQVRHRRGAQRTDAGPADDRRGARGRALDRGRAPVRVGLRQRRPAGPERPAALRRRCAAQPAGPGRTAPRPAGR